MHDAAAVDVEGGEDFDHVGHGDLPVDCPEDDLQVFLAGFEAVEDAVEEEGFVLEALLEEAEVTAVQLDPEAFALQVFEPAGPEVAGPVLADPLADRGFAEVMAGLLALDPAVLFFLALAVLVDATLLHGPILLPQDCTGGGSGGRHPNPSLF